jgi:hypothetical protein
VVRVVEVEVVKGFLKIIRCFGVDGRSQKRYMRLRN